MISEETIRAEKICAIEYQFDCWLEEVRLNGREVTEIKNIFESLKDLAAIKE